jgi:hypothetical protein
MDPYYVVDELTIGGGSPAVVRKRPTLTSFHPTPPGFPSLLQVSINSEEGGSSRTAEVASLKEKLRRLLITEDAAAQLITTGRRHFYVKIGLGENPLLSPML